MNNLTPLEVKYSKYQSQSITKHKRSQLSEKVLMGLSSNIEDYLEMIIMLNNENKVVRVKDISKKMGVIMPSVHFALHVLSKKGLINHENYGYIELTEKGRRVGEEIYDSHNILVKFLFRVLNVGHKTAEKDACRIEHDISTETLKRLIAFVKFVETCPQRDGPDWLKSFDYFFKRGKRPEGCKIKKIKQEG